MFDTTYLIVFLVVPLLLGLGAQAWVKRSFADASKIPASSGMTGAQTSQRMLEASNIHDVSVEGISGSLSDHYDPRSKTMRLSEPVGGSTSVAAVAVAAHETGHAIQDAHHEAGFRLRGAIVPAVGFASNVWMPLIFAGFIFQYGGFFALGAILFGAIVVFQLVTLPVEFGASHKAMGLLTSQGIISQDQAPIARRVLTAAAMTYVVAALISIMQFVWLLSRSR
jgi:Zn-dependent membrane protease YugP